MSKLSLLNEVALRKIGNIVLTHKTTGEHTKKLFYHTSKKKVKAKLLKIKNNRIYVCL